MWYEGVVAIAGKDPLVQDAECAPSSSGPRVSADNRQELSQVVTEANLKVMLISIMLAEVKEISTDPAHQNLDSGVRPLKLYELLKDTAQKSRAACSPPQISNS